MSQVIADRARRRRGHAALLLLAVSLVACAPKQAPCPLCDPDRAPTSVDGAAAAPPAAAAPCTMSDGAPGVALDSRDGAYRIRFRTEPDSIPLNEIFSIVVEIRELPGDEGSVQDAMLSVDGRMPDHRHGMLRQPLITPIEQGRWRVEGMLFHMLGYWELSFDVTRGGVTSRAATPVELE